MAHVAGARRHVVDRDLPPELTRDLPHELVQADAASTRDVHDLALELVLAHGGEQVGAHRVVDVAEVARLLPVAVPPTLADSLSTGLSTLLGTDPSAPSWKITSTPWTARATAATSRMSPSIRSMSDVWGIPSRCSQRPVAKLSKTRTRSPAAV